MSYAIPEVSIERGLYAMSMLLRRVLDNNFNDSPTATLVLLAFS